MQGNGDPKILQEADHGVKYHSGVKQDSGGIARLG